MAWFGRNKEQQLAEANLLTSFYASSLAAADSYELASSRVEEGDVAKLFTKLRATHLDYADDFKKRVKKLGGDPEAHSGLTEFGGRLAARINSVGSVRDLLISMRQGEENGVAMAREALEEEDLSGKSETLIESYNRMHIDAIRDLSEEIAVRGTNAGTSIELVSPQWMRYPKAGFWALEAGVLLIGYLFGRSGGNKSSQSSNSSSSSNNSKGRTSPRAQLGGDKAAQQHGDQISREVGNSK